MALLFIDSFDHYTLSQMNRKWTDPAGGSIVAGRTNNSLQCGAADGLPSKTFGADYATLTAGVAYKTAGFANWILAFTTVLGVVDCSLEHVTDGRLRFRINPTGATEYTSPPSTFVMAHHTWYYCEFQAAITGTSPSFSVHLEARVNGAEILSFDQAFSVSGIGTFSAVGLGGPGGGLTAMFDDFYCTDDEFLGDVRIGVLYPNAAGDSAGWTPTPAGNNWERVEEHPADDDTTYVSAAATSLKDLYNLDDIDPTFEGTIKGVQALWLVKKAEEGEGAVKGIWKSEGVEIVQSSGHNYLAPNGFHASAANYLYNIQTERVSLFTAADWDKDEINALQLGITRTL